MTNTHNSIHTTLDKNYTDQAIHKIMSNDDSIPMALTKDKYMEQYTQRVDQNYTEQLDKYMSVHMHNLKTTNQGDRHYAIRWYPGIFLVNITTWLCEGS